MQGVFTMNLNHDEKSLIYELVSNELDIEVMNPDIDNEYIQGITRLKYKLELELSKFKLKEGTKIMIDRTYTDFSNCEYRILELNKDECKIQLTKKGLNTLYNNDYVEPFIHEFVSDELNGVLYFGASEDLEPETFNSDLTRI